MRFLSRKRRASEPRFQSSAASWFEADRPRHACVGLPREFLADPQQVARLDPRWASLADLPEVRAAIDDDELPIPHNDDREGYCADRHLDYWLSGAHDLRMIRQHVPPDAMARVLDFGGATGRLTRHLDRAADVRQITLAELNLNHVKWVGEHFGPKVRPVKVCPQPHFPLPDASITLCVAFSVFTHIDSHETGWLAEISRVLAPGGWAYLSILSEYSWEKVCQDPMPALLEDEHFLSVYQSGNPMPAERLVYDYKPGTRYHCCNTFASKDYVRREWSRWLEVVDIKDGIHGRQTVVLLRKD